MVVIELLTDSRIQSFIRDGYLVLHPQMPDGFHDGVFAALEPLQGTSAVGNNMLPSVPQLRHLLAHPQVAGALQSLLGPDYYIHLHRHNHRGTTGNGGQDAHKDSLRNSRICVDEVRRHHHTRWLMLMYYPQDTPLELGPTGVVPRSQYIWRDDEMTGLAGPAGTVVIVHYDLVHGRVPSPPGGGTRHMVKFLFTRMHEPDAASWDHQSGAWDASDDPQEPIWRHMWDWHRGAGSSTAGDVSASLESEGVVAAYMLGAAGRVDVLAEGLRSGDTQVRSAAAYGLAAAGTAAVEPVADLLGSSDAALRARAADVLGDLGPAAANAVPNLVKALEDPDAAVRRFAVEALGTTGQALDGAPHGIAALLSDPDLDVRRQAALALARLGPRAAADAETVPALMRALDDESHFVRGHAIDALKRIGTPDALAEAFGYFEAMRWDHALNQ